MSIHYPGLKKKIHPEVMYIAWGSWPRSWLLKNKHDRYHSRSISKLCGRREKYSWGGGRKPSPKRNLRINYSSAVKRSPDILSSVGFEYERKANKPLPLILSHVTKQTHCWLTKEVKGWNETVLSKKVQKHLPFYIRSVVLTQMCIPGEWSVELASEARAVLFEGWAEAREPVCLWRLGLQKQEG